MHHLQANVYKGTINIPCTIFSRGSINEAIGAISDNVGLRLSSREDLLNQDIN